MKRNFWISLLLLMLIAFGSNVYAATSVNKVDTLQQTATAKILTGWQRINGHWYYYNSSGKPIKSNWLHIENRWYFLDSNGWMVTGFAYISGKIYYFDVYGIMKTGWQYIENNWYYMNQSGSLHFGWLYLNNRYYYMDKNGKMVSNQWITSWYYIKSNGVMATNEWVKWKNFWYYCGADGKYWQDTWKGSYYLRHGGAMAVNQWVQWRNRWYYCGSNGVYYRNTSAVIAGTVYIFDTNGIATESFPDNISADSLIRVTSTGGSVGNLAMYVRTNNIWKTVLTTSAYLGRNGVTSNKREGDGCTPKGTYTFGQAFGILANPGTTKNYLKLTSDYYWVDDPQSVYYNRLVNISQTGRAWSSAEHLIAVSPEYEYAIAINYNTQCIPGAGSAIFLHCSSGKATSGCIAVAKTAMIKILQNIKSDTIISIQ